MIDDARLRKGWVHGQLKSSPAGRERKMRRNCTRLSTDQTIEYRSDIDAVYQAFREAPGRGPVHKLKL